MNERIKELLDQSGLLDYTKIVVPEHEKFAELIVRECMALCKSMDETDTQYRYDYRRGVMDCVDTIKEHFGVEE